MNDILNLKLAKNSKILLLCVSRSL